jgi:hypothetical protein
MQLLNATDSACASVNDFGLIQWLTSNGGIFNPKQELRYDADSHLGIFAKEPIEEGELLVQIPADLIFGLAEEFDEDEDNVFCELVADLANELELGADSFYGPYMLYLSSILETGPTVPITWSDVGKTMLTKVLEGEEEEIPPENAAHLWDLVWLPPGESVLAQTDIMWFEEWCDDNEDLLPLAGLVTQKTSAGDFLIPIYDLFTHRNDQYYNVKTEYEEDGQYFKVLARRAIDAGEQLHVSYDQCDECDPEIEETESGTLGKKGKRGAWLAHSDTNRSLTLSSLFQNYFVIMVSSNGTLKGSQSNGNMCKFLMKKPHMRLPQSISTLNCQRTTMVLYQ